MFRTMLNCVYFLNRLSWCRGECKMELCMKLFYGLISTAIALLVAIYTFGFNGQYVWTPIKNAIQNINTQDKISPSNLRQKLNLIRHDNNVFSNSSKNQNFTTQGNNNSSNLSQRSNVQTQNISPDLVQNLVQTPIKNALQNINTQDKISPSDLSQQLNLIKQDNNMFSNSRKNQNFTTQNNTNSSTLSSSSRKNQTFAAQGNNNFGLFKGKLRYIMHFVYFTSLTMQQSIANIS